MGKKMNTTEAAKSLEWYLNGGDDEDGSVPTTQNEVALKESTAPMEEPIEDARQLKERTAKIQSEVPKEQSEIAWYIGQSQNAKRPQNDECPQYSESAPVQKRISAKMRKETLEAYKQAFLLPTKLSNRKAVYLSKETQERADLTVRRLGDRGSNLSSFVENLVRSHLDEYGEDIEKWRKL
ncbi:MAG: DUF3408 domain-containing protein [Prevotella intermedia]